MGAPLIDTNEDNPAALVVKEQIEALEDQHARGIQQLESLQVAILRMEGGVIALKAVLVGIEAIVDNQGEEFVDP